jgi:thioredoxin reductase (NADPH)
VAATMSSYLLGRLRADPRVRIRVHTEVTGLSGGSALQRITLTDNSSGDVSEHPCAGLFCFIGARPPTEWLSDLALDAAGFIRTDAQLDPEELGATWTALGRAPLPFETSMPTVFAAGDVRLASLKRVASAVGEGASAVRSIHAALGPPT